MCSNSSDQKVHRFGFPLEANLVAIYAGPGMECKLSSAKRIRPRLASRVWNLSIAVFCASCCQRYVAAVTAATVERSHYYSSKYKGKNASDLFSLSMLKNSITKSGSELRAALKSYAMFTS